MNPATRMAIHAGMGFLLEFARGAIPAVKEWSASRPIPVVTLRYIIQANGDGFQILLVEQSTGQQASRVHECIRTLSKEYMKEVFVRSVPFSSYKFGRDFRELDLRNLGIQIKGVTFKPVDW